MADLQYQIPDPDPTVSTIIAWPAAHQDPVAVQTGDRVGFRNCMGAGQAGQLHQLINREFEFVEELNVYKDCFILGQVPHG